MQTLEQLRTGQLYGTQKLTLREDLDTFPREIFDLADSLEILDLSGNHLKTLPDDLLRLHRLRIIFCSQNQFTSLPEVLGRCPNLEMVGFKTNRIQTVSRSALPKKLRWLILTDNAVTALPEEIGQCSALQKLMLAGNRLRDLPQSLSHCERLELIRIAANDLNVFPTCLLDLPNLAWLAYAGNPFCENWTKHHDHSKTGIHTNTINWARLKLEQRLGEGASGVIHQASLDDKQSVAVKIFKGEVTSDGLPHCEMTACLHASAHPALIPIIGKITAHPQAAEGLVMPLINRDFHTLAAPPNFESCTRDIYPQDSVLTSKTRERITLSIASAVNHLHLCGILHGDLYAHNILHNNEGQALLGDFGAASFLPPNDQHLNKTLQNIEMRALDCLFSELKAIQV